MDQEIEFCRENYDILTEVEHYVIFVKGALAGAQQADNAIGDRMYPGLGIRLGMKWIFQQSDYRVLFENMKKKIEVITCDYDIPRLTNILNLLNAFLEMHNSKYFLIEREEDRSCFFDDFDKLGKIISGLKADMVKGSGNCLMGTTKLEMIPHNNLVERFLGLLKVKG